MSRFRKVLLAVVLAVLVMTFVFVGMRLIRPTAEAPTSNNAVGRVLLRPTASVVAEATSLSFVSPRRYLLGGGTTSPSL